MSIKPEERIKLLKSFCREEPENPFNHYSLFLETQKVNLALGDRNMETALMYAVSHCQEKNINVVKIVI